MKPQHIRIQNIVVEGRARKDVGDVASLARSIESVGLLHPIVLGAGNRLISGYRRIKACELLGWKEIPASRFASLADAYDQLRAECEENTCRLGFSPAEAVTIGRGLEVMESKNAKGRQGRPGQGRGACSGNLPEHRETREAVGASVGMGGTTYERAKQVIEAAEADPKLAPIAEEMARTRNVHRAFRALRRVQAVRKVADAPKGKYTVLYADPPWQYGDSRDGLGTSGASAHYPTLSIAQLCELPVSEWATRDAVLFLWVPSPILFESAAVIKAWGFEYKASFVWDKVKHNLGHYNSVRHEFLLVCTRGSCLPQVPRPVDSIQSIPKSRTHSEKPEAFRRIIDTLYPKGKRIELFARTRKRGWATYGNH